MCHKRKTCYAEIGSAMSNAHTNFQGSSSTTHENGTDPIPEAAEKRMPNAAGERGRGPSVRLSRWEEH